MSLGDERRVAEIDVNAAGLQIDYGSDPREALKTLANARANLEKLGHVDFQLVAMQNEAESIAMPVGSTSHERCFKSALQIARRSNWPAKTTVLRCALAQTESKRTDYETARASLDELVNQDASNDEARIALGIVLTGSVI